VSVTPGRAVIMAGVGQPWRLTNAEPPPRLGLDEVVAFHMPGWVKIAMDIRVDATADGSALTSETRVKATDEAARRAFRAYWTLIRIPSGLIRRIMHDAVAATAHTTRRDAT
jgi:hypothetical protein